MWKSVSKSPEFLLKPTLLGVSQSSGLGKVPPTAVRMCVPLGQGPAVHLALNPMDGPDPTAVWASEVVLELSTASFCPALLPWGSWLCPLPLSLFCRSCPPVMRSRLSGAWA